VTLIALLLALADASWAGPASFSPVRLQLKWYHQFQFAGYYAAQVKGFYRKAGLDVTILEANPDSLPVPMVESGAAEFGVSDMEVFQGYQQGKPLVALGVVFQHSPMAILSLARTGIRRPSDLAGHTVMFQGGQGLWEFQVMLQSEGIPLGSVNVVPHTWHLDDLLEGRVDAVSAYVTNEPYQLRRRGVAYSMLRPEDYGVDFYGDILFTGRAFAARHPDLTEAFRRASFQGWEYAMEHPQEIIDTILALPGVAARGVTRDQLEYEAAQMHDLVLPGLVDTGHMNPGRFRRIAEWWTQLGMLTSIRDVDGFLFTHQDASAQAWLRYLKVGALTLLAVILLVVLWIFQLRRTVRARTRALRSEVAQHRRTERALRESEARYRSILDACPDAITFTDLACCIRLVSPRALNLWRLEREDQIVGRSLLEFLVPEDRERGREQFWQILQGQDPGPSAYRGLRPDGSLFQLELNGAVILDQDAHPASLVLVIRDVSERCRVEQERQELQARLDQANRMESLGILAGGVAHDMNNVLTAILGMATVHLEQAPRGSRLGRCFEVITQAAERGGKMVRGLLNFARQTPREERRLDLNLILEEEVRLLEHTTLARVRVVMDLASGLAPIRGDAAALAHAFMNLCVNAVDAMPDGGTLTLGTRTPAPGWVEVSIADTGCGMPQAVLDKAMDPFFTTKGPGKGTGLGLSMVFSAVKAHRGSITLRSSEGLGTVVTMRFPAGAGGEQPEAREPAAEASPGQEPMAILLVDDDDLVRQSVQAMMEQLGYCVCSAASGEEALAHLDRFVPDSVVLDWNMPGIGGEGTLAGLRRRLPEVPVLLVSGFHNEATLALEGKDPYVSLLHKPFGIRDLQDRLAVLHH
jgi:PAS domain S-box-containing protein